MKTITLPNGRTTWAYKTCLGPCGGQLRSGACTIDLAPGTRTAKGHGRCDPCHALAVKEGIITPVSRKPALTEAFLPPEDAPDLQGFRDYILRRRANGIPTTGGTPPRYVGD